MALYKCCIIIIIKCPRPNWESLQSSPDPLVGFKGFTFKGPTSKGRGRKGRGRKGKKEGRKNDLCPRAPETLVPPLSRATPTVPRGTLCGIIAEDDFLHTAENTAIAFIQHVPFILHVDSGANYCARYCMRENPCPL